MNQIVSVAVGQPGLQINSKYWNQLILEHGLDYDGLPKLSQNLLQKEKINVYFDEKKAKFSKRYVPRSVFVDLSDGTSQTIKSSKMGKLFSPDSYITTNFNSITFANCMYNEGYEMAEIALDQIRKEIEKCDLLQGLEFTFSIDDPCGAGLGSLLVSKIREEYPDRVISVCASIPSFETSNNVISAYHIVLAIQSLIENADLVTSFDLKTILNFLQIQKGYQNPNIDNFEDVIAQTFSNITAPLRSKGTKNLNLRTIAVQLVLFPRLHFFIPSLVRSPIEYFNNLGQKGYHDLIEQTFLPQNIFSTTNLESEKTFTALLNFRGEIGTDYDFFEHINSIFKKNSYYQSFLMNHSLTSFTELPPYNEKYGSSALFNTSAIVSTFNDRLKQFSKMFEKKAFIHWFTSEGMDEMEFVEAENNLKDLVLEYQQYSEQGNPLIDDYERFWEDHFDYEFKQRYFY
ncbi:tubulin beta chain [Anaeramoeba ignava]|uniref:Tubulin beta chain n=1 Tax=Anaeramoeba ignava TaxID=1746090 RepID=A0A9Q0RHK4_ANAIG|nr:tubulin beta chain [Anaeramoeba ignava]